MTVIQFPKVMRTRPVPEALEDFSEIQRVKIADLGREIDLTMRIRLTAGGLEKCAEYFLEAAKILRSRENPKGDE